MNWKERALAWTCIAVGLALAAATANAGRLMANLDGQPELVERLLHGDIAHVYLLPGVWQGGLDGILSHSWMPFLSRWAVVPMVLITLVVMWWHWRRGADRPAVAGVLCLLGAALPWAAGAAMLARITQPSEAGQWIAMMLGAVFWGATACAGSGFWELGRELFRQPAAESTPSTAR